MAKGKERMPAPMMFLERLMIEAVKDVSPICHDIVLSQSAAERSLPLRTLAPPPEPEGTARGMAPRAVRDAHATAVPAAAMAREPPARPATEAGKPLVTAARELARSWWPVVSTETAAAPATAAATHRRRPCLFRMESDSSVRTADGIAAEPGPAAGVFQSGPKLRARANMFASSSFLSCAWLPFTPRRGTS